MACRRRAAPPSRAGARRRAVPSAHDLAALRMRVAAVIPAAAGPGCCEVALPVEAADECGMVAADRIDQLLVGRNSGGRGPPASAPGRAPGPGPVGPQSPPTSHAPAGRRPRPRRRASGTRRARPPRGGSGRAAAVPAWAKWTWLSMKPGTTGRPGRSSTRVTSSRTSARTWAVEPTFRMRSPRRAMASLELRAGSGACGPRGPRRTSSAACVAWAGWASRGSGGVVKTRARSALEQSPERPCARRCRASDSLENRTPNCQGPFSV